jgi:hypothetical protein
MLVGDLRRAIADIPDDAQVIIDANDGDMLTHEYTVSLTETETVDGLLLIHADVYRDPDDEGDDDDLDDEDIDEDDDDDDEEFDLDGEDDDDDSIDDGE